MKPECYLIRRVRDGWVVSGVWPRIYSLKDAELIAARLKHNFPEEDYVITEDVD